MNVFRIAFWDLRRLFKDKQVPFWLAVFPLLFIFLFGMVLKDMGKSRDTWVPVVNLDEHELSTIFIDRLKGENYNVDIRKPSDEHNLQSWSRAIVIPATFSAALLKGEKAGCTLTKGQGSADRTLLVQSRLIRVMTEFTGALIAVDLIDKPWTPQLKEKLLDELAQPKRITVEKQSHSKLRPPPVGFSFTLPGYLIMFVLINSIMMGGNSLAEERAKHQYTRLAAAPLSPFEIIVGKMLGRVSIPLIQSILLLAFGYYIFDVPLGDHPWVLVPVVICFSFCCGSIGMLFGAICSTEQQIMSIGMLTGMSFSALGGCMFPMEITPDFVKTIAMFVPTFWGLQGLHDVMSFGKSFNAVIPECAVLLLFASLFTAISLPFLKSE